MESNNDIEIFGTNTIHAKRVRHGLYIAVNTKNRNAYLSRELSKELFGTATTGRINIVHSKIENNWYIAAANATLFNNGFECFQNDTEKESVYRVNGAAEVFKNMVQSMTGGEAGEQRYTLIVSPAVKEYEGLKLHLITLQQ